MFPHWIVNPAPCATAHPSWTGSCPRPCIGSGNITWQAKAGIEVVGTACGLAVDRNTPRLPAIINLINRLVEPVIAPLNDAYTYPQLTLRPEADCRRYEMLYPAEGVAA